MCVYIRDSKELSAFCEQARSSKVLAVDTEFLREKSYYPKLCLIQLATQEQLAIVDALEIDSLVPLAEVFRDDSVTKVFHACVQDIEVIYHTMGVMPTPVFDTQLAAAFLGKRMQLGYGALVQSYLGVSLEKSQSLTDWSKRPLDDEQLTYAADDVRYLPEIYQLMYEELVTRGRLAWLYTEELPLTDPERFAHEPDKAYLQLRRVASLTRRQLAIARELCAWREKTAQTRDVPRRWLVPDEVLLELCRLAPRSVERLKKIRGTEQISKRDASSLVYAVVQGLSCPAQQYPRLNKEHKTAHDMDSIVDLMYALLRLISEASDVSIQLIASRSDLLEYAVDKKSSRLGQGWRQELVGSQLDALLDGQVGLTIKDGRVEIF